MTAQERYQVLQRLQCALDGHYTPFIELDWVPDRFLCLVCGERVRRTDGS